MMDQINIMMEFFKKTLENPDITQTCKFLLRY